MAAKKKPKLPELWVVFDTNAIYTGSASFLLRKEVAELIKDNSQHPDLTVRWILPEVVRHEREYQMQRQANAFLPTIQKLERLLGHNLNITQDILALRVQEAIDRAVGELGLMIDILDPKTIDIKRMMLDATHRKPPFEEGDSEKGFRDALVLESFVRLRDSAPQNPKSCRLALVTGDKLLLEAAASRTVGAANIRLLESAEELKGLINTLVSTVDEAFVTEVSSQAKAMFFVPKNEATIYYAQGLSATIQQRLRADIGALPPGAERFVTGGWTIAAPQFVKKVRQNISWSSRVQVKLEAVKDPPLPSWETLLSGGIIPATPSQKPKGLLTYLDEWKGATPTNITISTDPLLPTRQLVAAGRIAYDVRWQAVLSTTRKLTRPKVDEVQLVDVVWG